MGGYDQSTYGNERDRVCPVCGKRFLLPLEYNVYRLTVKGKLENYCSYTCYRTVQKRLERGKTYKNRVK